MQNNDLIAKKLNEFFKNAVSTLNMTKISVITTRTSDGITDPMDKAIDKYKFHPSILLIQKHLKNRYVFSFKTVEMADIEKEINNINPKNAATNESIPPKILKSLLKFHLHKLFKVGLSPSKKCVICFIESPLKTITNSFYFILKGILVLKIFKLLS